ncbi:hypothetical protein SBV1_800002 [Verrucomicrobia bacterium]|nr:hypothetical protein SBV1_800002 [Verrucomicrobiota bacterium]
MSFGKRRDVRNTDRDERAEEQQALVFGCLSWHFFRKRIPGALVVNAPSRRVILVIGDSVVGSSFCLHLPGSAFVVLRKMHREDSIFELGANLRGAGLSGEGKTVREAAVGVFDVVVLPAVLIEFAVACDGQGAIFHRDLHVLLLYSG